MLLLQLLGIGSMAAEPSTLSLFCPRCAAGRLVASRRGIFERLFFFAFKPYRCRRCMHRVYVMGGQVHKAWFDRRLVEE